jgi:hypothetical protein
VEAGDARDLALESCGKASPGGTMPWVLTKAPVHYHSVTLSDDDVGTIKIALATAATSTMDFWGKTHPFEGQKNIYDLALDKVMAMEEEGTTYDSLCLANEQQQLDLVVGGVSPGTKHVARRVSWLDQILNQLFLWI